MKRSIAAKIFLVAMGLFAAVLLVQWFVVSRSFNSLYAGSIYSSMQAELRSAIIGYRPKKAYDYYQPLNDYALETGSPVLVFSENYDITDRDLMYKMRLITVASPQAGEVHIPIAYLYDIYGPNAPYIAKGRWITVGLVQVGSSAFYEPLSLVAADFDYRNRTSIKKYGDATLVIEGGFVSEARNLRQEEDLQATRAEMIYSAVKDCLLLRLDIEEYLEELCRDIHTVSGFDYKFIREDLVIDGVRHYFVTAQRVVITGYEREYIDSFFLVVYSILGLVLMTAALLLSKWLSAPLKNLNQITQRIAGLDFSDKIQHRSEDELGQLGDNINQMSESLRQALLGLEESNAQLERASRLSRENEERIKRLLADLAHEFKTPLGLVSGYVELIQQGIRREESDTYFAIIEQEILRLTDLVDEAVELTKLQSGNWTVNIGNHSLRQITDDVRKKFERKLSEGGFAVAWDVADIIVACDAQRIGQVLSNFLSNAIKFSDEHRHIALWTETGEEGVTLFLGNSGALSPEEEDRIWRRNYSGAEAPQARLPSQGIGLDIVRTILEAHHSEYGVTQQGGMVIFSFSLPIAI